VTRKNSNIAGFLADTWWFGLSRRLSEKDFKDLAILRATQGFSAIQLVVGVPPEVGPEKARGKLIQFFPDVARAQHVPSGEVWLPLKGVFADVLPQKGQVVIFSD